MAEEFGTLLCRYRERHGKSGRALSAEVGVTPSVISMFESGNRRPNRDHVLRIARGLGLDVADTNTLLVAAGHLPEVYDRTPPWDPDLLLVGDLLGDETIPLEQREELRLALRLLCRRWRPLGVDLTPLRDQLRATRPARLP